MKTGSSKKRQANQETDNASTRDRLLEVAGQLFAEKGYDRTTSKEITERAEVNIAAVNYHFGGVEELYSAVIEEASRLIATSDQMNEALEGKHDAKDRLEAFLGLFVRSLAGPASSSWKLRILAREFSAPTIANQPQRKRDRLQKISMLKEIVGDLMELPTDHPAVARSCINVLAPCFILMIGDRPTLKSAFPQLGLRTQDAPALLEHMVQFAIAGMTAVAKEAKQAKNGKR